jgi:hypothetical protein
MKESASRFPRRSRRRVAATTSTGRKIEAGELPVNLLFTSRMVGTLPEAVTPSDLELLNSGLRWLFADLRRAHRYFQNGEGNGRGGAVTALGALWRFVTLFAAPLAEGLHTPIHDLQTALEALEQNNVLPMLKPAARPGRAKSSRGREALKGHAAGTVQRLLKAGIKPVDAHRRVAKELTKLGVRPERGAGAVTATTVRHWCDEVANDVNRLGPAAVIYDAMFTESERERFSFLVWLDQHPEKGVCHQPAHLFALDSLAAFVRENFSEKRGSQKPS